MEVIEEDQQIDRQMKEGRKRLKRWQQQKQMDRLIEGRKGKIEEMELIVEDDEQRTRKEQIEEMEIIRRKCWIERMKEEIEKVKVIEKMTFDIEKKEID